ncbi:AAA family ATPase [Seohaeicola saemankumensis]|nr:AAA family ATPase [Seohaeicola saemankumensis]MCA0873049.1 AAA family ATPase [Seohaeicola saemankumensis]
MRFVDRESLSPPKVLSDSYHQKMREDFLRFLSLDPKERAQTRPPMFDRIRYADDMPELRELFLGKCAFCERPAEKMLSHLFRPTAEALPMRSGDSEAHLYYGWLAQAWQNHYAICPDCMPSPEEHFPVKGRRSAIPTVAQFEAYVRQGDGNWLFPITERNVLLDPCADKSFGNHLEPEENGVLSARTERGAETVRHFRLNRPELIDERIAAFAGVTGERGETFPDDAPFAGLLRLYSTRLRRRRDGRERTPKAFAPPSGSPELLDPGPQIHLTRIRISAFKSLEDVDVQIKRPPASSEQRPPEPAMLILGENATGKSSFLEAVALAALDQEARADLGLDLSTLCLDPKYLGAAWQGKRDRAEVHLSFADEDGNTSERSLIITSDGYTETGTWPESLPIFAYGAYRHFLESYRNWRPSRPVRNLFHSDDMLSNPERWLMTLSDTDFDMVVQALRLVIGGGFHIIDRNKEEERCYVVTQEDDIYVSTPLRTVSSGFRTILALCCDVMRWVMQRRGFTTLSTARGVVLIDEVESHLHPRWKVRIMDGLRRALPAMTFIASTHDPLCLRGMRDGEVMVLSRIAGTVAGSDLPSTVETLTELPNVTKLTVEQLLTSDLFDLFDTDDPATALSMAELADALNEKSEMDENRRRALREKFADEIRGALPVGSTEVARLVQEAVAEFVRESRKLRKEQRKTLREATKKRIRDALERG